MGLKRKDYTFLCNTISLNYGQCVYLGVSCNFKIEYVKTK